MTRRRTTPDPMATPVVPGLSGGGLTAEQVSARSVAALDRAAGYRRTAAAEALRARVAAVPPRVAREPTRPVIGAQQPAQPEPTVSPTMPTRTGATVIPLVRAEVELTAEDWRLIGRAVERERWADQRRQHTIPLRLRPGQRIRR